MMSKLAIFLLVPLALAARMYAASYYVSSSAGNDKNSGLSPKQAWKTIARVNKTHFRRGDRVLFRRGDLWRETLIPSSSGTTGRSITYGAYGSGAKPVISGSDMIKQQTIVRADGGIRYVDNITHAPAALWSGGIRMTPVAHLRELRAISQWFYDAERKRVYFISNRDSQLELQVRDICIDDNAQSHIVYEDLHLEHAREGLRLYSWNSAVNDVTLQNSTISTERSAPHGTMSAGVYASVKTGTLSRIVIRGNNFIPYPSELEHWGVYFVQGVSDFKISGNQFGPAGEDAITVWHSDRGLISENSGGGNGENTVDVKDSHDIVIRGNRASGDGEYNIVVHGVDSDQLTYNINIEKNRCRKGGQAGHLTAGIVLLFARNSKIHNNIVGDAYGAGIFVNDKGIGFANEISANILKKNGTKQMTGAITLEDVSRIYVRENIVAHQGSRGYALQLEGGPHTRAVRITGNTFYSDSGRMLALPAPRGLDLLLDQNDYITAHDPMFRVASGELSFSSWRKLSGQDFHSRINASASARETQMSATGAR